MILGQGVTYMLTNTIPSNDNNYQSLSDLDLLALANDNDDDEAMLVLIYRYKKLVKQITNSYYLPGADRDDLIQEGLIGLFKAIRDFKPTKNSRFDLFANLCIKRQVITALKTATRQKHQSLNQSISLYKPLQADENSNSIIDILEDERVQDPEIKITAKETLDELTTNISITVSPLEHKMFLLYIDGATYKSISERLQVSEKCVTNGMFRVQKKLKQLKLRMDLDR